MIPPVASIPFADIPAPSNGEFVTVQTKSRAAKIASWRSQTPLTSPALNSTPAPQLIAQELPGGYTPTQPTPPPPSTPSTPAQPKTIIDTGNGYPNRLPVSYFGPALSFGSGTTSFGVISKFPLSDKFSVRPSATFGGNGTTIRVPLTYDFALGDPEPFESNPLATFHAGAGVQYTSGGNNGGKFGLLGNIGVDVSLFENIALVGDFNSDFSSSNDVTIGVGFQF
jgi:hypothetical protein